MQTLVHECTGYGTGAFEAPQEVRLGVDAGVEQLAQQDGGAKTHGVECNGKRRFLCDQYVDDMRHERAHGRVIDTVERGSFWVFMVAASPRSPTGQFEDCPRRGRRVITPANVISKIRHRSGTGTTPARS